MQHNQGEMEQNASGAKRESNRGRGRFDLLPYEALEAWAIWSEEGALKYGPRNWEKGLLVSDCINRLVRHATKASNGWTDEDHLAACMWNAAAAITMMARRPDLNDHPWHGSKGFKEEIETTTLFGEDGPVMTIEEHLEEKKKIRKAELNHHYGLLGGKNKTANIKGIPIDKYIAQEKAKKELEEFDGSMKNVMDAARKNYEKKLLGMFRSIACLAENDRDFLRLSIDCEGLDIPAVEKWLASRNSLEDEAFPKPEDPDTICGMSRRDFFLKKISATPTNLTRLEVRDEDTHEYDQVGISYFMEYAEKHPDYEIAEVAVIANKTVYRCRPKL